MGFFKKVVSKVRSVVSKVTGKTSGSSSSSSSSSSGSSSSGSSSSGSSGSSGSSSSGSSSGRGSSGGSSSGGGNVYGNDFVGPLQPGDTRANVPDSTLNRETQQSVIPSGKIGGGSTGKIGGGSSGSSSGGSSSSGSSSNKNKGKIQIETLEPKKLGSVVSKDYDDGSYETTYTDQQGKIKKIISGSGGSKKTYKGSEQIKTYQEQKREKTINKKVEIHAEKQQKYYQNLVNQGKLSSSEANAKYNQSVNSYAKNLIERENKRRMRESGIKTIYDNPISAFYDPTSGNLIEQSIAPGVADRSGFLPVEVIGETTSGGKIVDSKTGLLTDRQLAVKNLQDKIRRQSTALPQTFVIGGERAAFEEGNANVNATLNPDSYTIASGVSPYSEESLKSIKEFRENGYRLFDGGIDTSNIGNNSNNSTLENSKGSKAKNKLTSYSVGLAKTAYAHEGIKDEQIAYSDSGINRAFDKTIGKLFNFRTTGEVTKEWNDYVENNPKDPFVQIRAGAYKGLADEDIQTFYQGSGLVVGAFNPALGITIKSTGDIAALEPNKKTGKVSGKEILKTLGINVLEGTAYGGATNFLFKGGTRILRYGAGKVAGKTGLTIAEQAAKTGGNVLITSFGSHVTTESFSAFRQFSRKDYGGGALTLSALSGELIGFKVATDGKKTLFKMVGRRDIIVADSGDLVPLRNRMAQVETITENQGKELVTITSKRVKNPKKVTNVKEGMDFSYDLPIEFATSPVGNVYPTSSFFLEGRGAVYLRKTRVQSNANPLFEVIKSDLLSKGKTSEANVQALYNLARKEADILGVPIATISPKRLRGFEQPEQELIRILPKNYKPTKTWFSGFTQTGHVVFQERGVPRGSKNPLDYWGQIAFEKHEYLWGKPNSPGEYLGHGKKHSFNVKGNEPFFEYHDILKVGDTDPFLRFPHGETAYKLWKTGRFPNKAIYSYPQKQQRLIAEAIAGHEYWRPTIPSLFTKPVSGDFIIPTGKQVKWYVKGMFNPYLRKLSTLDRLDLSRYGEVDPRFLDMNSLGEIQARGRKQKAVKIKGRPQNNLRAYQEAYVKKINEFYSQSYSYERASYSKYNYKKGKGKGYYKMNSYNQNYVLNYYNMTQLPNYYNPLPTQPYSKPYSKKKPNYYNQAIQNYAFNYSQNYPSAYSGYYPQPNIPRNMNPLNFDPATLPKKKGKMGRRANTRDYEYAPSLTAVLFGITAKNVKKKKSYSGFEIRPIVIQ